MPPLLLIGLAVVLLAAALAALARREHPVGGAHLAERDAPASQAAREALSREVRSLTDALAEADPGAEVDPDAGTGTGTGTGPSEPAAPPAAPAAQAGGWDPTPSAVGAVPQPAVAYAALADDLLAGSRSAESALARWAADLHLLGPRLVGHEDAVVQAVGADAPVDRRRAPRGPVALDAVARARYRVGAVLAPGLAGSASLPALPDAGTPASTPEAPSPVQHEPRERLLERAVLGAVRARALVDSDPVAARRLAWESDLAAFDAVLLGSAGRGEDRRLVSVRLRRQLALRLLAAERDPEGLATTRPEDVGPAVRRVRDLLRACLEAHERPALDAALGPWATQPPPAAGRLDDPGHVA